MTDDYWDSDAAPAINQRAVQERRQVEEGGDKRQ